MVNIKIVSLLLLALLVGNAFCEMEAQRQDMEESIELVARKSGNNRRPTQAPTKAPTRRPTQAPTTKPTKAPTNAPTKAPTKAPTTKPTTRPSTPVTAAPTTKPTTAPTTKPTTSPTTKPTTAPTTKPTTAPSNPTTPTTGGRICPAGQIWSPAPGTTWQWQLTGTIDQSINVQMYDIDLFDASAAMIQQLHAKGRVVICYFSTQYENWRPDAASFPASVLGSNLDDWPGERYVDIRSAALRNIMTARLDLAVSKGCDGVEPDNVDGYTNKNGFSLTAAHQSEYNKFLAQQAHARGLSIGLKNDLDQVKELVSYFDWALNEQCYQYGECDTLKPFVTAGKAVFGTEYSGSTSSFCSKATASNYSWLSKKLALGAEFTACCPSGGCQSAAYKCVAASQRRSEYAEPLALDAELEAIEAALAPSPFEEEAEIVAENEEIVEEVEAEFVAEPAEEIVEEVVEEVFAEPAEEVVA